MNLKNWVESKHGRASALAKSIGVPQSFMSKMVAGKKQVPFEQCMPIETATAGEVTRRDLRPFDFHIHWPELLPAQEKRAHVAIENVAAGGA